MSKDQTDDLKTFLTSFDAGPFDLCLWLREFVWDLYPHTNELIYDNYNALAIGWSPTDRISHIFCSIALGRSNQSVMFGFYWGSKISDPEHRLLGQGSQFRYIRVADKEEFPKDYVKKLMEEAYSYSLGKVKDAGQLMSGVTIVKSISPTKRARGRASKTKQLK